MFLDGQQVATTTGLSAEVTNPGPGAHSVRGSSRQPPRRQRPGRRHRRARKLSKPRKVKALRGAKGGKRTAGAKWKAPASAGGLQIKPYQVVVLNKAGKAC